MDDDVLVGEYLSRLDAAAETLSPDRRAELVGEVRAHIHAALTETGSSDETTVRNILERLGSPEEIVAGEADQMQTPYVGAHGPALGGVSRGSQWGAVEIIALVLLGLAWPAMFLPFGLVWWVAFGFVGLLLSWASGIWSVRQKVLTTIVVVSLYASVVAFLFAWSTPAGAPVEQDPIVVPGSEEKPAPSE